MAVRWRHYMRQDIEKQISGFDRGMQIGLLLEEAEEIMNKNPEDVQSQLGVIDNKIRNLLDAKLLVMRR